MCELFGFSSSSEYELNDYLREFYTHCELHPHGWGLAILDEDKLAIWKEPIKARRSVMLGNILLNPIICKKALAHIRYATMGDLNFYNCHPFVKKDNLGRRWTLIHNGTIFDGEALCKYSSMEEGETDSERILLAIVDKINDANSASLKPLGLKERFEIVSDLITELSYSNKLNLIISDGEQIFVHTNQKEALHYLKTEESVFFSTQALDDDERWKEFPLNQTFSFLDGEVLFEGEAHSNEYVLTEEQLKFIEKFVESLKIVEDNSYAW